MEFIFMDRDNVYHLFVVIVFFTSNCIFVSISLHDKMKKKKDIYSPGLTGLLKIYPTKNLFKSFVFPSIFTIIIALYEFNYQENFKGLILQLSDLIISIAPALIGFILTGYALMIGLTETETIRKMSKSDMSDEPSLFQIVSSTFAFILIALSIITVIAVSSKLLVGLTIYVPNFLEEYVTPIAFNFSICVFLIFFLTYSVFATIDIILNVFSFGQFIHTINHIRNMEKKTKSQIDKKSSKGF